MSAPKDDPFRFMKNHRVSNSTSKPITIETSPHIRRRSSFSISPKKKPSNPISIPGRSAPTSKKSKKSPLSSSIETWDVSPNHSSYMPRSSFSPGHQSPGTLLELPSNSPQLATSLPSQLETEFNFINQSKLTGWSQVKKSSNTNLALARAISTDDVSDSPVRSKKSPLQNTPKKSNLMKPLSGSLVGATAIEEFNVDQIRDQNSKNPNQNNRSNNNKNQNQNQTNEGNKNPNPNQNNRSNNKKNPNQNQNNRNNNNKNQNPNQKKKNPNQNQKKKNPNQNQNKNQNNQGRNKNKGGNRLHQRRKSINRSTPLQFDDAKRVAKAQKRSILGLRESKKTVPLFSHLPQFEKSVETITIGAKQSHQLHPTIIKLGLKIADKQIIGSNARCVGMLKAFIQVIIDYHTPDSEHISRDLGKHLSPAIQFLTEIRPLAVNMGNAINWLKLKILNLNPDFDEAQCKKILIQQIESYIESRIIKADQVLSKIGANKIVDGDVILTYACSSIVEQTIREAFLNEKRNFEMIIVDSAPHFEGKELMRRLTEIKIPCTYVLINALSYIMKDVSKVFLGAFAFMANGHAMSRAGTASVAMVAYSYHVPVIFCCELNKFCDRVQLDSICFNEIAPPDQLAHSSDSSKKQLLQNWKSQKNLKLLNLVYDLTPREFIKMIITEAGIMPPTSIPVVIREISSND